MSQTPIMGRRRGGEPGDDGGGSSFPNRLAINRLRSALQQFTELKISGEDASDAVRKVVRAFHENERGDVVVDTLMTDFLKLVAGRSNHPALVGVNCKLTTEETVAMAREMAATTEPSARFRYRGVAANTLVHDEASTGGAGNIYPLLLSALVHAVDVGRPTVNAKIASNGSPGTIDTLQAAPGFDASPAVDAIDRALASCGQVVTMATDSAAPVDARMMALRRASGTMDCAELVIASILAKRLASGADGFAPHVSVVVFEGDDSKFGRTAEEQAAGLRKFREVGARLVEGGDLSGFVAIPVNNDSPICPVFGRRLFLSRIQQTLCSGPESGDPLAGRMIELASRVVHSMTGEPLDEAAARVRATLGRDGPAWRGFKELLLEQGARPAFVQQLEEGRGAETQLVSVSVTASTLFPELAGRAETSEIRIAPGGTRLIEQTLRKMCGRTPEERGAAIYYGAGIEFPDTGVGSNILAGGHASPADIVMRLGVASPDEVDGIVKSLRAAFQVVPRR